MITIFYRGNHYRIEGRGSEEHLILTLPLHRIFLRSTLKGDEGHKGAAWSIPIGVDPLAALQSILDHFAKYGIKYALDQQCCCILDDAKKQKIRFKELMTSALKAKVAAPTGRSGIERALSDGFVRKLTKFQTAAVRHLAVVQNGANFSVPGSGKTTIALAYYNLLRNHGDVNGILVIGPASCFGPWEEEYKACFSKKPRSVRLAGNSQFRRRELLALSSKYEILLTTYHSAARDIAELQRMLLHRRFLVILDESHYVKRPQGGKLVEAVLALAKYATRRLILTGTPMPNGLADLWSQITFLWPDQLPLGTIDEYLRSLQQKNTSALMTDVCNRISPLFYRITKSHLRLPRPKYQLVKYEMSPLQRRIYEGVAARFLRKISEAPQDRDALREWRRARAVRLLQIAVNPTLLKRKCNEFRLPPLDLEGVTLRDAIEHYGEYEMPNKIALAIGLVRDLCAAGNKVLVWSTFVHNLTMLARQLSEFNPVVVYGEVPYLSKDTDDLSREMLIRRFREDRNCRILIANPAACAESISLHQICHHAIYLDRSFNCAHYLQSLDRIHRLGLPASATIYYYLLLASDSIDEIVHERLKAKMRIMRSVVEADLPGAIPGYWSEDLGDEETADFDLVEKHIKHVVSGHENQTN